MEWNLSPLETAGVVGVGLALAFVGNKIADTQETATSQKLAMLAGGTAIYTAGVVIGSNRPAGGWITTRG